MPVELLPLAATMFASAAKLTVVAGLVLAAFALGRLSAQRERSHDHDAQRAMWFARLNDADGGRRRALWSLHRREETIRALEVRLGGPASGAETGPVELEPDGGPFAELLRDPVGLGDLPAADHEGVADETESVPRLAAAESRAVDEVPADHEALATDVGLAEDNVSTEADPFAGDDMTWHLVDDLHLDDETPAEASDDGETALEPQLLPEGDVVSVASLDEPPPILPVPVSPETTPEPLGALMGEPLADVPVASDMPVEAADTEPLAAAELEDATDEPAPVAETPPAPRVALTPIPPLPLLITAGGEAGVAPTSGKVLTPLPPLPAVPGEDASDDAAGDEPTHELAAAPRPAAADRAPNRRISSPLAPL